MKTLLILIVISCFPSQVPAQGRVSFANTSSTLISAGGSLMPVSGTSEFIFALFLADHTTVETTGISASFTDSNFQYVDVNGYATNSAFTPGRLSSRFAIYVGETQGYSWGSTVDYVVRGWSANAGYTWAQALVHWNGGSPASPMFIGSSTVGNNMVLSGGLWPDGPFFGFSSDQIQGFDMAFVPEPSTQALAILGGCAWFWSIRHRQRHRLTK